MDNISQCRRSTEDSCTASMYLSFDAESTMSTACYKTLEAMTDISALSCISAIDADNIVEDKHNSTLENNQDSQVLSPLKTVKKMDVVAANSPLRVLKKNILREYKAMCSTPSKEQLLKSVDVTRGSDGRCVDLGVAFLGVDDEQPAIFPPPPQTHQRQQRYEDNKENAMPESGDDGSTLSVSSSVEIATSVIEMKRLNSVSTAGSLTGEESLEEIKAVEVVDEFVAVERNMEEILHMKDCHVDSEDAVEAFAANSGMDRADITPKAKLGNLDKIETINEDIEMPEELTPKVNAAPEVKKAQSSTKFGGRPKIAVLSSRNARRSVCEPNLQTNKPSRISTTGVKRQSLLPITRKAPAAMDVETEIPLLMDKLLKISNTSMMEDSVGQKPKKDEAIRDKNQQQPVDKRRSAMGVTKGRSSLMPPSLGEKRPFSFTQRMSVIVKTTLNSPARKMARKSVIGTSGNLAQQQQRRSMMATRFSQTSRVNKVESGARRSMMPNSKTGAPTTGAKSTANTLTTSKETSTNHRKSLYPPAKRVDETKIKPPPTTACGSSINARPKIQETIFTCNSCREKFRVKSLLDAHRRSHEGDVVTAIVNKKLPTTAAAASSSGSILGNTNQCKYCDKKFALLRALHIHLLQNCSKIPPSDKRKLQFTEMNHVEKARLPNVFVHGSAVNSAATSTQATPRAVGKQNVLTHKSMEVPKSSAKCGNGSMEKDFKNKSCDSSTTSSTNGSHPNVPLTATAGGGVSGSLQKPKKVSAHSGVYWTPSKTLPCHVCKLTFKSILEYTQHSLATHGYKTQKDDIPQLETE